MDVWHTGRKKKTEHQAESSDDKEGRSDNITPQGKDAVHRPAKRKEDSPASDSSEWETPKRRQKNKEKQMIKKRRLGTTVLIGYS